MIYFEIIKKNKKETRNQEAFIITYNEFFIIYKASLKVGRNAQRSKKIIII